MTPSPDDELFLILAQATAGELSTWRAGERRRVMVFARAASHEDALAAANAGLEKLGWKSPAFEKIGIVELGPHLTQEDRAPAEHAMAHGFALRVFGSPLQSQA